MPWTVNEVEVIVKGLSDKQKETWVKIANGALDRCTTGGGDAKTCDATAIRTASAMVKNMGENGEPDWVALSTIEEAATARSQALRLTRDLTFLLADRTVPQAVTDAATALRSAMLKTWTELATDANANGIPDSMEPVTEPGISGGTGAQIAAMASEAAATGPVLKKTTAAEEEPTANVQEGGGVVELISETLAESDDGVALLAEGTADANAQGPMTLRVKLIEPGKGNSRDKHYYSAAMLKRDAHLFQGAKMYESDHNGDQKSTRSWVSTITRVVDFTPSGAPIAEAVVHDPNFAQRVRNLHTSGLLGKMACSIYAKGDTKAGEVNGEKLNIVDRIVEALDVDWVTRAGAGGQAMTIAEVDAETPPVEPVAIIKENDMTGAEVRTLVATLLAEYAAKVAETAPPVTAVIAETANEVKPKAEPKVSGNGERTVAEKKAEPDKPLWQRQATILEKYASN